MRARPRRAYQAPLGARIARIAAPVVAAGALVTTVAVTAWPSSAGSLQARPAASSSTLPATPIPSVSSSELSDLVRTDRVERSHRSSSRSVLTEADEKVSVREAVEQKEADQEAAEAKAAQEKAAKKEAKAAKKAAAKKRAEQLAESVVGSRYTTSAVKLRTEPSKNAKSVDVIDAVKKVKVTDTVRKGYRQVVVDGKGRWITDEYLSKKKPSTDSAGSAQAGISGASCSKSSGIESGLGSNAARVYRAMCATFPEVSSFGGRRASNDFHGSGRAVDAMISSSEAGWRLANWLRDNASELKISEIIYSQQIWTVQRSGEGWRGMSDRGSATANHYDHVHVSVY